MPRGVRVRADAGRVVAVRDQVLLAHRTGERRDCEVVMTCRLVDGRGSYDKWWCSHGRGRLDSLELEQKHLN